MSLPVDTAIQVNPCLQKPAIRSLINAQIQKSSISLINFSERKHDGY